MKVVLEMNLDGMEFSASYIKVISIDDVIY
jgi:hypothetical protein